MASSGFNDCSSQLNDSIDRVIRKIPSSEHEEALKGDQMAAKKLSNEKVSPFAPSAAPITTRCAGHKIAPHPEPTRRTLA